MRYAIKMIGKLKVYSVTETAKILGVSRQGIYHWLKKGWVKVKRDFRNLPVFTEEDIKKINEWRNTLRAAK
ncbi:MAG: MerR family transcriptional regulator [Candidatus Omnitrophica bacterium]|nr:MerR family transcriptional regulator [Candidatus Omnitrophota bacterium]